MIPTSPTSLSRTISTPSAISTPSPTSTPRIVSSASSLTTRDTVLDINPSPDELTREGTDAFIQHSQHILNKIPSTRIKTSIRPKPSFLPPIDLVAPLTANISFVNKNPKIIKAFKIIAFISICIGIAVGITGTVLGLSLLGIAIGPVGWIILGVSFVILVVIYTGISHSKQKNKNIEDILNTALINAGEHADLDQDVLTLRRYKDALSNKKDNYHAIFKNAFSISKPTTYLGVEPSLEADRTLCFLLDFRAADAHYLAVSAHHNYLVALAHARIFKDATTPFFDMLPKAFVNMLTTSIYDLENAAENARKQMDNCYKIAHEAVKDKKEEVTRVAYADTYVAHATATTHSITLTAAPVNPESDADLDFQSFVEDEEPATIVTANSSLVTVPIPEVISPPLPDAPAIPNVTISQPQHRMNHNPLEQEISKLFSEINLSKLLDFSLKHNIGPISKARFILSRQEFKHNFSLYKTATINFIKNKNIQTEEEYIKSYINLSKSLPKRSVSKESRKENLSIMHKFTKCVHNKLNMPVGKITQLKLNLLFT